MKIPRALNDLIESFQKLPGIGPKTAQRLSYYLLHVPESELENFAQHLTNLKKEIILVVEQPLDVLAIERTGKFKGVYHVLHGAISPLDNIGPDEIFIDQLLGRVGKNGVTKLSEIIIATNPTMEGDATAMYLSKKLKAANDKIQVTRLGMGIPTGADLEYADETTLTQAIEGRRVM